MLDLRCLQIEVPKEKRNAKITSGWLLKQVQERLKADLKLKALLEKQQPIMLATVALSAECVELGLTKMEEDLFHFLPEGERLRVLYAERQLLQREKELKRTLKTRFKHRLKDFDFIKTIGQGGFAHVHMGKLPSPQSARRPTATSTRSR